MKVSNVDIYRSEWLNVVFAGRNQAYGAYELRKHNASTTNRATLIAVSGFLLVMAVPTIINKINGTPTIVPNTIYVNTPVDISKIYKIIPPKTQKATATKTVSPPVNDMVKNIPPAVSREATEEPPTQAQLQHVESGPVTMTGTHSGEVTAIDAKPGPVAIQGTGNGTETNATEAEVVLAPEVAPEYPGGEAAFNRFLQKNIHYPQLARETGVQGKAYLQFVVERDGHLTDITIVRNPGAGTGEEAERVLKMSARWKPGQQNGKAVRVQYTVPVNFALGD